MQTRFALTVLIFVSLLPFSCTDTRRPPPADPAPVVILLGTDVSTFDPQIPFEVESSYVLGNIFETLIEFDSSFHLLPGLAIRWTNPDDRTWVFSLSQTAYFSDGTPLKAPDVVFSINRLKSMTHSDLQAFTQYIESVRALDDHTVQIMTESPVSILNNLVFIPIMNEKSVKSAGEGIGEKPVGTGPFKLVQWDKNKKIVLIRNEFYRPPTRVEKVEFIIHQDPETVLQKVLESKPDITMYLPFRRIEEFESRRPQDLHLVFSNGLAVEYIIFNIRPTIPDMKGKNPLSDIRFRKALAYATDSGEIIKTILKGYGRPASQVIAPEVFGYDPSIRPVAPDLEKAKQLLTEAGYSDVELPFHTVEGGTYRLENLLIEQWARIGIKGRLKLWKDNKEMSHALSSGQFAVSVQGYSCTSGDASEFLTFGLHTPKELQGHGTGNYAGYSNPEVDKICESNLQILKPRTRLEALQKSMKLVSEDIPYLPLLITPDLYIVSSRVKWTPTVTGELKIKNISYRQSATMERSNR